MPTFGQSFDRSSPKGFDFFMYREFSRMVKKLYIISPEEIKKRNGSSAREEGLLMG